MVSEKRREYSRKYYHAHREERLKYGRKYRAENVEKEKIRGKKYQDKNKEKINETRKKWNKANPLKRMILGIKTRSKKDGLNFNLDLEYLKQLWDECGDVCPMTGIQMIKSSRNRQPNVRSLDRIVPDKGYIKGNVRFVSFWYNRTRNNWGDNLTLEMCQKVVECALNMREAEAK